MIEYEVQHDKDSQRWSVLRVYSQGKSYLIAVYTSEMAAQDVCDALKRRASKEV